MVELINFLTFFVNDGMFVRFNFDIFQKLLELIFIKVINFPLVNENAQVFLQIVKLMRFFVTETTVHYDKLTPKERADFEVVGYKVLVIMFDTFFEKSTDIWMRNMFQNSINPESEEEELLNNLMGLIKAVLTKELIPVVEGGLDGKILLRRLLGVFLGAKRKTKERIVCLVMAVVARFIIRNAIDSPFFISYKIFIGFLINHSVKDAIYVLSNIQGADPADVILIEDFEKVKQERDTLDFFKLFRGQCKQGSRNILASIGSIKVDPTSSQESIHSEPGEQARRTNFRKLVLELLINIKEKITKVEIFFLLNLLKSPSLDFGTKQDVFKKIFTTKTTDVQDLFEGMSQLLDDSSFSPSFLKPFMSVTFATDFIVFLFESMKAKSVAKCVLKILFTVLKEAFDCGLIHLGSSKCLFKSLIKRIEYVAQRPFEVMAKAASKRMSSQTEAHILNELEAIRNSRRSTARELEKLKNYTEFINRPPMESLGSLERSPNILVSSDVCVNDQKTRYTYVYQFFKLLNFVVKELNEVKTNGIMFLLLTEFYKKVKIPNEDGVLRFYLEQLNSSIISDAFILKGFLINPRILDQVRDEECAIRVAEYLYSSESPINQNIEKPEFNNNYIKNRHELQKFMFEIKMLFLNFVLKDEKLWPTLTPLILSFIGEILEQMYDFLRINCEVLFVEPSPTTPMAFIKREFLEINIDVYQGLREVQSLFVSYKIQGISLVTLFQMIFNTFGLLRQFIERSDDVIISFARFEKLKELSTYDIVDGQTVIFKNVWTSLNTGFVNTYA